MKVAHTHSLVLLSRKVLIAVARCQVRGPGSLVVIIVELVHQPWDLIKCPIDLATLVIRKADTTKMRGKMVQLYTSRIDEFSVCHTSIANMSCLEHTYGETQDSIVCTSNCRCPLLFCTARLSPSSQPT